MRVGRITNSLHFESSKDTTFTEQEQYKYKLFTIGIVYMNVLVFLARALPRR
jgi:hypothetical protein